MLQISDQDIRILLREIDSRVLSLAVMLSSKELKNHILDNLSKRCAAMLMEDIDYIGCAARHEIEQCQDHILDIACRLINDRTIIFNDNGSNECIVQKISAPHKMAILRVILGSNRLYEMLGEHNDELYFTKPNVTLSIDSIHPKIIGMIVDEFHLKCSFERDLINSVLMKLTGAEKASILLLLLGPEYNIKVFNHLSENECAEIMKAMESIELRGLNYRQPLLTYFQAWSKNAIIN